MEAHLQLRHNYGNTYTAPGYNGNRPNGGCNFNEYINYLVNGKATETPFHYELESAFSLQIGTVMQLVDALLATIKVSGEVSQLKNQITPRRITWKSTFRSLGKVFEQQMEKGRKAGKNVALHASQLEMVMGGLSLHSKGLLQKGGLEHFKANMRDVVWQTVRQDELRYKVRIDMVDWDSMVARYPDLKDPTSGLYKRVNVQLWNYNKLAMQWLTEGRAVGLTATGCIKNWKGVYGSP
ncbi:hypothetical protein V8F06_010275 [Rhypophila decipiens]